MSRRRRYAACFSVHCLHDTTRASRCLTMLRAGMLPKKQRQPTLFESQEKTAAADDCTDETSGSEDPGTTEGAPIVVPGDEVRVPPLVVIVVCSPAPPALFCACRSFSIRIAATAALQLVDTPQPGLGAIVCELDLPYLEVDMPDMAHLLSTAPPPLPCLVFSLLPSPVYLPTLPGRRL